MGKTLFASVYNCFLDKITDDMYMELTPQNTLKDLRNLLVNAIPGFEFPRKSLEYTILENVIEDKNTIEIQGFFIETDENKGYEDASYFISELTSEEINILAILMLHGWLQRQITSVENTRMKYSGSDFKMTSQANHLGKLLTLLEEIQKQSRHLQRLYKRRKISDNGIVESNWSTLREDSVLSGKTYFPNNNVENDDDRHGTVYWEDFGEGVK